MMLLAKSVSSSPKNWRSTWISFTGSSIALVWSFFRRRSMIRSVKTPELFESIRALASVAVLLDWIQEFPVKKPIRAAYRRVYSAGSFILIHAPFERAALALLLHR